jgi:glycosyltransferase involved in cell wall biosynthesis
MTRVAPSDGERPDAVGATTTPASPLVSVIIPTHGRPAFLPEAIRSVLEQTEQDFECIVVDDASPEPVEVEPHPKVRLIRRPENGGPAAARNTGIEHAAGRYLAFLDDDDLYEPERLTLGLKALARARVGVCWLRPVGPEPSPRAWHAYLRSENRVLEGNVADTIVDRLPPHLGQATVERSAMLPFDAAYRAAEDIEWWIRMAQRWPVATEPHVGYRLRRHASPRLTFAHDVRIRTNLQILQEHAAYFQAHPRAAAWRWRLQARFAERAGDHGAARAALLRSARLAPRPSTLASVVRSFVPGVPTGA